MKLELPDPVVVLQGLESGHEIGSQLIAVALGKGFLHLGNARHQGAHRPRHAALGLDAGHDILIDLVDLVLLRAAEDLPHIIKGGELGRREHQDDSQHSGENETQGNTDISKHPTSPNIRRFPSSYKIPAFNNYRHCVGII